MSPGGASVFYGVGNALRFIGRAIGLYGEQEAGQWDQEGQAVDQFVQRYRTDPEFKQWVDMQAKQRAIELSREHPELKFYVNGRVFMGVITRMGPAATIGDFTRSVENGGDLIRSFIDRGVLGIPREIKLP